jgi:hypothetical protein
MKKVKQQAGARIDQLMVRYVESLLDSYVDDERELMTSVLESLTPEEFGDVIDATADGEELHKAIISVKRISERLATPLPTSALQGAKAHPGDK